MTEERFIEKAVSAGWNPYSYGFEGGKKAILDSILNDREISIADIVLNPLVWQAVGKTMGWKKYAMITWYDEMGTKKERERWRGVESFTYAMHKMVDSIASGNSIEQFLATLPE